MYSIKEKNFHLRNLHAPSHVSRDLELLKKLDPRNDQLPSLQHAPARNAERILYLLLDVATAEQIRDNRRAPGAAITESRDLTPEQIEQQRLDALQALNPGGFPIQSPLKSLQSLQDENKNLQEQLEEKKFELDETIEEKEDLETQLDKTKSELKLEKKSPVETAVRPSPSPTE